MTALRLQSLTALVVASSLSLPSVALAQPEGEPATEEVVEVPASQDDGGVDAINAKAVEAFKAQRYEEAAKLFEEAYSVDPEPNYLFNIGRVYEESGNFPSAIDYYERFIQQPAVELKSREVALERLRVLRAIVEETKAKEEAEKEPEKVVAPTEPDDDDDGDDEREKMPPIRIAGIALLVAGAAGLGVAGGFAGSANNRSRDLNNLNSLEPRRDAIETGKQHALIADIMFGAGGALALTGAILIGVSFRKGAKNKRAHVTPTFGPRSAGLNARIRF